MLLDYNRQEIKQLGPCHVSVKFRSTVKCVHCGMYIPLSDDKHQMVKDSSKKCTGQCGCNSNPVAMLPHATVVFSMQPFNFYIVPDRLKPILGVGDALTLGLTSFHCPIYKDWQSNCDLTNSVDSIHSNANSTVRTGTGKDTADSLP